MIPFIEDLQTIGSAFEDNMIKIQCYFIGHKWTEWELFESGNQISKWLTRNCLRCDGRDSNHSYEDVNKFRKQK